MKRSLYHTYQMNLGTSCLLNRTIPKNLSTKWGALHSARVRVWNTSTPPLTGWARTYVIQRRPCSAGFGLPRILIVLPDGGKMVCIAVLLLLIHPVVSHKCGLRFHVAAQPVQRHTAAQPVYQRQHFCQHRRVFRTVDLLAEHGQRFLF